MRRSRRTSDATPCGTMIVSCYRPASEGRSVTQWRTGAAPALSCFIIAAMPLIRCQKCGQAYDVPGVVAVRLPNAIATCVCGEWLAGSKAALLARMMNPDQINEVDLKPFLVNHEVDLPPFAIEPDTPPVPLPPGEPRSISIDARGARESVHTIFTIQEHPLWIGRKGCHVELAEAELSIRHCSISLRGLDLVVRDAGSHTGTFLDGEQITEAIIGDGVQLLRVRPALREHDPQT